MKFNEQYANVISHDEYAYKIVWQKWSSHYVCYNATEFYEQQPNAKSFIKQHILESCAVDN